MPFQHPHWQESQTPLGKEVSYLPRRGSGFILALFFSDIVLTLSLYGAFVFLKGWFMDHEDILAGGVVLFMISCGVVYLGAHFLRHLFRRVVYTLGHGQLKATTVKWGSSQDKIVEKALIKEVIQLYTPPGPSSPARSQGSWRTCLVSHDMSGSRKEFFLEGMDKEESDYLASLFSQWAGVKCRTENTNE
jgi:hypothetical protein